jgi:hypothetical protein
MSFGSCSSTTVGDNNEIFWIGNITNSTNLNITRLDGSASSGSVSYFVVEFNDGSEATLCNEMILGFDLMTGLGLSLISLSILNSYFFPAF